MKLKQTKGKRSILEFSCFAYKFFLVIATRRTTVSVGDMNSLENEFRKLDVCQSNRKEDISNRPEPFTKNTAGVSLSPLDLFIRDLDERKGKLPCCQEVTDIQTSVERFLKTLLLEVEKEIPFYKTTLVKSGSFYEATKVSQPDEFDYILCSWIISLVLRTFALRN